MTTILIWYFIGVIFAYITAAVINDYYIPKNKIRSYWEIDNWLHCLWSYIMASVNILLIISSYSSKKPTFKRKK